MTAPLGQAAPHGLPPAAAAATIVVVGSGLAGALEALALARCGARVLLLAPEQQLAGSGQGPAERLEEAEQPPATAWSYGALRGRSSCRQWRHLEQRHGPLGFRPCPLALHGGSASWGSPPLWLQALAASALAVARVDPPQLLAALPAVLAAAGVERRALRVEELRPGAAGGWQLRGVAAPGAAEWVAADQVVLAAGAGCRRLWPSLPERLGVSWAGVLSLERNPGGNRWLDLVGRGWIVQPRPGRWQRPRLEAGAAALTAPAWIVDPGLAPAGAGVVVGQITLVRPGGEAGPPPPAAPMEARLRQGLARFDPALADLGAVYRQVPVSFCRDGQPLVGPVDGAPGLWVLAGFSGAFTLLPAAAERLAARVIAAASAGSA